MELFPDILVIAGCITFVALIGMAIASIGKNAEKPSLNPALTVA